MRYRTLFAAAVVLCSSVGLAQETVTKPAAAQPAEAKKNEKIYDEGADGAAQINAAIAKAKKNNRRVLIQWGANWCGWCHKLHDLFAADRDIKKTLNYEYDVVLVDVGKFDKNMELAAKYGAALKGNGIPYLTVLDGDGKIVTN